MKYEQLAGFSIGHVPLIVLCNKDTSWNKWNFEFWNSEGPKYPIFFGGGGRGGTQAKPN